MLKKYIAQILTVVVLLASIPLDAFAATATSSDVPSQIKELSLEVGDDLIDTTVTSGDALLNHEATGWVQDDSKWSYGMPKGKNADGTGSWGWWRGTRVASSIPSENKIALYAQNSDGIVLLPQLPSSNYKFEATFTINNKSGANGSFGLITNIDPSYADSTGATMFVLYAADHQSKHTAYNWNKQGGSKDWYRPGHTAPGTGESITLTVYVYNGTNYCYIDGKYARSIETIFTKEGPSLCGFFISSDSNMTVNITDISVKELKYVEKDSSDGGNSGTDPSNGDSSNVDPSSGDNQTPTGPTFDEDSLIIGNVLYQTDFEDTAVGELPEGWQKGYPGNGSTFGWGVNDVTQRSMIGEVVEVNGDKVLNFASSNTDAYITAPATGTLDYIFEATIISNFDTQGEFGMANNFYAGVNDANGCMYTSIYVKHPSSTISTIQYRNGGSYKKWDITKIPAKGETVKLKIISYGGKNYIYYNDILCAIAPHRTGVSATSDNPGFFTYGGNIYVTDVKITELYNPELVIDGATVSVNDDGKVGIDVELSFDKTQDVYPMYISGDYAYSDSAVMKFGAVVAVGDSQTPQEIEEGQEGVTGTVFTDFTQDDGEITFVHSISEIPEENYDKFYTVRPYAIVNDTHFYGETKTYSAAELANGLYAFSDDEELKGELADAFINSNVFVGKEAATLTFTLFSDFHYKAGMYPATISDLKVILERADESNSAFIMSAGDLTNDMKGSPELYNTYLNYYTEEGDLLPAYNIYGNHELETGNTMEDVTWTLANTDVVWGTEDGTYDASIGYYYFESNGFRIIGIDTQHSYNPTTSEWEHNKKGSWGAPTGNTKVNSLGPTQLAWLEKVLTDAAEKDIPCIVVGHDRFSGVGLTASSADAAAVCKIFKKVNDMNPGTVLMCINGHKHTNHQGCVDGVFYLDTNTTLNGLWQDDQAAHHYTDEHTYMFEEYDDEGNLIITTERSLNTLSQGKNTWFFEEPLSAVITINEYGVITIDGSETKWAYDIVPEAAAGISGVEPRISSGTYWDCNFLGHNMVYKFDDTHHWTECVGTLCDEAIRSVAHTYDQQVVSDEYKAANATCEAKATYYYSCVCGAKGTETFETGELAEHSYGEWKVVKEPTANEKGLKERECSECGDVQREEIPVTSGESDNTGSDSDESGENDSTGTGSTESGSSESGSEGTDGNESTETESTESGSEGTDGNESTESGSTESGSVGTDGSDSADENAGAATEGKDAGEDSSNSQQAAAAQLTGSNVPATGDHAHPLLWMMVILLSGTALCGIGLLSRQKKKS